MNEAVRITIEEWAGDNGIDLSDDQIEELAEGIETARQMSLPTGYGTDRYESQNKAIIRRLEHQIDMLIRYIRSKGYQIVLHENKITRMYFYGGDLCCTQHEEFR